MMFASILAGLSPAVGLILIFLMTSVKALAWNRLVVIVAVGTYLAFVPDTLRIDERLKWSLLTYWLIIGAGSHFLFTRGIRLWLSFYVEGLGLDMLTNLQMYGIPTLLCIMLLEQIMEINDIDRFYLTDMQAELYKQADETIISR